MKMKTPPPGALPEGIIPWTARFSGACRCGKRIKQGQSCLYDKAGRHLICRACSKTAAREPAVNPALTPAKLVMDRIKQLYVMPKPLSRDAGQELQELLGRLKIEFAREYSARRLLSEVMRLEVSNEVVCIAMRYGEKCHSCGDPQPEGTAAVWCKSSHRIWCLDCRSALK